MFQEQSAFKQAKYVGLKVQEREIYFNYKVRQWFDANNRFYQTNRNGEAVGKIQEMNIRYEEVCNKIHEKYPKCPIFAGEKYKANVKLTEPVKILLKHKDVGKNFDKCIGNYVGPIFNELVNESKKRKNQISIEIPKEELFEIPKEEPFEIPKEEPFEIPKEEPIQESKKQKTIDFQSVLAEFADEDWE